MKPLTLLTAALLGLALPSAWAAAPLATFTVQASGAALARSVDGQVEAVRDATLSAQVQGAVVSLAAQAGDRVVAGQELARIDARAAQQTAAASAAQVDAARAAQQVATREYERQVQLFQKQYISQAALDRAEAQWRASLAQVQALQAQAGAAATQSGFFVIKAPFAGVVGHVPATLGDMALPGKPLLTVYDPSQLRVTAFVPQQLAATLRPQATGANPGTGVTTVQVEVPGATTEHISIAAARVQVLPTVDAQSHTVQVRVELPAGTVGVTPGMFARLWVGTERPSGAGTTSGAGTGALLVPASAVVRRAEMTGVYVLDAQDRPLLRQVRLGRPAGDDMVEVLSGVRAGERVALAPQIAAKVR